MGSPGVGRVAPESDPREHGSPAPHPRTNVCINRSTKRCTATLTPRLARRDDMGPCVSACPAQHQARRRSRTHPAVTAPHSVRIPRGSSLRCRGWVGARVPSGCRSPDTPQILAPSRIHDAALPALLPRHRSSSHGSGVPDPVRARSEAEPRCVLPRGANGTQRVPAPLPPHPRDCCVIRPNRTGV
jgi:hypothetical protein